jgi:hypothetical protein
MKKKAVQKVKGSESVASKNKKSVKALKGAAREGSFAKIKNLVEARAGVNGIWGIGQPPLAILAFRFFDNSASSDDSKESLEGMDFILNSGGGSECGQSFLIRAIY